MINTPVGGRKDRNGPLEIKRSNATHIK